VGATVAAVGAGPPLLTAGVEGDTTGDEGVALVGTVVATDVVTVDVGPVVAGVAGLVPSVPGLGVVAIDGESTVST
jgi:hypothetical protein